MSPVLNVSTIAPPDPTPTPFKHHPPTTASIMKTAVVTLITALAAVLSLASAQFPCQEAYRKCDFRFQTRDNIPSFSLRARADRTFTPRIVVKPWLPPVGVEELTVLGILNSNAITVQMVRAGGFTPIARIPADPPMSATHLKPLRIRRSNFSGVAHQRLTRSQRMALRGKCFRIYFKEYEMLSDDMTVRKNFNNVPRRLGKCVVFRIR